MKVSRAVILAAGYGTRMLPASKVVPKEILPVVDRPAIQLVVEEAVASGIDDITIVVSPGRSVVLEYFNPVEHLERHLEERGKFEALELVRKSNTLARITAVEQAEPLGLGHAVLQARRDVGDPPFAVMLPDDVFDCERPCLSQLLDVAGEYDAPVVALLRVPKMEASKYGIVDAKAAGNRLFELVGMVEKPAPERAPSDLAIIGRYVLTPDIFEFLERGKPGIGGEIQLTDALFELSQRRKVYGYEFQGTRYDLGDRAGFVMAQVGFGLKRPEVADKLRTYLRRVIR